MSSGQREGNAALGGALLGEMPTWALQLAPGPAHTPGDTEVAMSVDIPQCRQKSASWKVAQELQFCYQERNGCFMHLWIPSTWCRS